MKKICLFLFAWIGVASLYGQSLTVNTFNEALHTGANTITQSFTFPNDVSIYDQVFMTVALTCPTGGCDPWDRFATIRLGRANEEYEIGRYITPYGNGNCSWTLDVSDYRTLLSGDVELISFIETWSKGWEVSVDFEFVEGTPDYQQISVKNLWVDYMLTYGDTIFYSIDLEEKIVPIPSNAEKTVLRIINTGHGQGNTQNAAEFAHQTHTIEVDGVNAFSQDLWYYDCGSNPCSPQGGNWTPSRAGWCPGMEVIPDDYDLTSMVTPGGWVSLDYVLEPYFNRCSPWNPNCNLSADCMSFVTTCTYNGSNHTEPNYKIASQLIFYGNAPLSIDSDYNEPLVEVFPNPSHDLFQVNIQLEGTQAVEWSVWDLAGKEIRRENLLPVNKLETQIDLSDQEAGIYLLKVKGETGTTFQKIVLTQ